jgi:hypothetical protein
VVNEGGGGSWPGGSVGYAGGCGTAKKVVIGDSSTHSNTILLTNGTDVLDSSYSLQTILNTISALNNTLDRVSSIAETLNNNYGSHVHYRTGITGYTGIAVNL